MMFVGWVVWAGGAGPTVGEESTGLPPRFDPDRHLPMRDVRIGMKGYGLSVFRGAEPERFEVEVTAVVRNAEQIGTDVFLIRLAGANLEVTGPVAGMSGSPIYLEDADGRSRMAGALAFGWPFGVEPVAGVQPVEAMFRQAGDFEARQATPDDAGSPGDLPGSRTPAWRLSDPVDLLKFRASSALTQPDPVPARDPTPEPAMRPLAVPLAAGGWPRHSRQLLDRSLARSLPGVTLTTTDAAGGRVEATDIVPGGTLIVPVLTGDLNLVATGTCTDVVSDPDGDIVIGFGHPMFGEGVVNLPMAAGEVDAVIGLQSISFKMGAPGRNVGTLFGDGVTGVTGRTGTVPPVVPIELEVLVGDAQARTFRFEVVRHAQLTPAVLGAAVAASAEMAGPPDPRGSLSWDLQLDYGDAGTLRVRDASAGGSGFNLFGPPTGIFAVVRSVSGTVQTLADSPFGPPDLAAVRGQVRLWPPDAKPDATLRSAVPARRTVSPGQTVAVDVGFDVQGQPRSTPLDLSLPDDLRPGEYTVQVTTAARALVRTAGARPGLFSATDTAGIVAALNRVAEFPDDALYVWVEPATPATPRGVAVGRTELDDLPASRAALLRSAGLPAVAPATRARVQRFDRPFLFTGGEAAFTIEVQP